MSRVRGQNTTEVAKWQLCFGAEHGAGRLSRSVQNEAPLERTCTAERTDREEDKQQRNDDGHPNQPIRHVAGPRPEGGI